MTNKEDILKLLDNRILDVGIEVGAGEGHFTDFILKNKPIKKLYCIDLWKNWDKNINDGKVYFENNEGEKALNDFKTKIQNNNVIIIRGDSKDEISKIKEKVDFCCLDGNMTDNGLIEDIKVAFDKLKNGGVLFGFKYGEDVDSGMFNNSKKRRYRKNIKSNTKRVLDFFAKIKGLKLTSQDNLWMIEKPVDYIEKVSNKQTLEVCIHCHRYQHRLCWMLSSILQQKGDIPNIIVNISFCENDGTPTTKEVCEFFIKQGLNIKQTIVTEKQASNRAVARNIQVKNTTADWMLFADSDLVYDAYFFEDIHNQIRGKFAFETRCIGADRISLDIPFCIKYFEEDNRQYPCVVENVADIPAKWPIKRVTGKNTAPGNFQLANVAAINMRGGFYSKREGDIWRGTKSDRAFRCHMGGRCPMEVKSFYHLNHDRGGPDIQR